MPNSSSTSDDPSKKPTVQSFVEGLLKYWVIISALILILLAGAETRWQVQQLINHEDTDAKQWVILRSQTALLENQNQRISEIEKHVTPEAIQEWGRIKGMVDEDHQRLQHHLENHND